MRDHCTYDYAIIRVVPRVEREEFINVGVIVSCPAKGFLEARIELDERRLMALDATLDVASIRTYLATIPAICRGGEQAGPIGRLSQRERFHWLVAPGYCKDPTAVLEHLLDTMVRPPRAGPAEAQPGSARTSGDGG